MPAVTWSKRQQRPKLRRSAFVKNDAPSTFDAIRKVFQHLESF